MSWKGTAVFVVSGALAGSLGLNVFLAQQAPAQDRVEPSTPKPCSGCNDGCGQCGAGCALKGSGCRVRSLQGLALDEQQRETLSRTCADTCRMQSQLGTRVRERLGQLQAELRKRPPNRTEALRLAGEIGQLRTEFLRTRVDSILDVQETLTPEQLADLLGEAKTPCGRSKPCGQ